MRTTLLSALALLALAGSALAGPDKQSFFGGGLGFEVLSKNGSGVGFYFQGFGGYNFDSIFGVGLHAGYSNVSGVSIQALDFGGFFQATEPDSGLYGRFYLDGVRAVARGPYHGVVNSQLALAPGVASGMLIPSAGSFHMVPEVAYRIGLFDSAVHMISATFNLMWDF